MLFNHSITEYLTFENLLSNIIQLFPLGTRNNRKPHTSLDTQVITVQVGDCGLFHELIYPNIPWGK